jgi:hypothetical protein
VGNVDAELLGSGLFATEFEFNAHTSCLFPSIKHTNWPNEFQIVSLSFVQLFPLKLSGFEVGVVVGVGVGVGAGTCEGVMAGVGCGVGAGLVFEEADLIVTPLLQTNFFPFF